MMLSLLEQDNFQMKKVATTNGGEYAGSCPYCSGHDRFRVWPKRDRYWCRVCGKSGDAIQYLRDYRGLSFPEAASLTGKKTTVTPQRPARPTAPPAWVPEIPETPSAAWQETARSFLDWSVVNLWEDQGATIREWLHEQKGLSDETIRKARLGFNPKYFSQSGTIWGLAGDDIVHLSEGLVIPTLQGENLVRLRIRSDNPGEHDRYKNVTGSTAKIPMVLGTDKGAAVIVESELDAILLCQEAGDLAYCIALGSASTKPDKQTHDLIKSLPVVLLSLDADDAGQTAAWSFWPETYRQTIRYWGNRGGKDPSEARINGLDLRTWVIAGIFRSEENFERFCIQTIDGGLSDHEAIKQISEKWRK
jgi:hypothetical protein